MIFSCAKGVNPVDARSSEASRAPLCTRRPSTACDPLIVRSISSLFGICCRSTQRRVSALPRMSETTIKHLPREKMLNLPVPVPPQPETARIIEHLEEVLSRLDAALAGLGGNTRRKLAAYRASVLKAACEGRPVPTEAELARAEGREYEPADQLLARILEERRAHWEADQLAKLTAKGKPPKDGAWKKKYVDPDPPDTSELPDLPEGWVWVHGGAGLAADSVRHVCEDDGTGVPEFRSFGWGISLTADLSWTTSSICQPITRNSRSFYSRGTICSSIERTVPSW